MADTPQKKSVSDKLEPVEAEKNASPDELPEYGEDLNSTMMAIDISKLNLDITKTGTKAPPASGESHVYKAEVEEKPTGWRALWGKVKTIIAAKPDQNARKRLVHPRLKPFVDVWICDPNVNIIGQVYFYLMRMFLLAGFFYCQNLFMAELERSFAIAHPASEIFLILMATQLILVAVSLLFRASPSWVLTLPLCILALVMSYGALFYHTADPLYFNISGMPVSESLNSYYAIVLGYAFFAAVTIIARGWILRVVLGFLTLASLIPVLVNFSQEIRLEYAFFGVGLFKGLEAFYLQPIYIIFHGVMPFIMLVFLILSIGRGDSPAKRAAIGTARSLFILFACMIILNFSLMQKNRVFHAFNLIFSKVLHVGGVEVKILNQNLKIETRNFTENEGVDQKARYHFRVEKAKEKNKYTLRLQDSFNFPVKFISKDDLRVFSDDVEMNNYSIVEENEATTESGRYTLTLALKAKQPPVEWDAIRQSLKPTDRFAFRLADPAKVARFVVRRDEDVLLEVESPKESEIVLPLNYFQTGAHKLTVALYDDLKQEIYKDELTLSIKLDSDLLILSPLPGDAISKDLGVLIKLRGPLRDSVRSMTYEINGSPLHEASGLTDFHSLDVSSLPDGPLKLVVKVNLPEKSLTQEVEIIKRAQVPQLLITQPSMGIFAERETTVAYRLSDTAVKMASLNVWVNGQGFADFKEENSTFKIPVTRWEESEIYLVVQGVLSDGTKFSDWVQVNRGLSLLDLKFDIKSLNFLNISKIAVVLDASVSSLDNWQGKSKWNTMSNLVVAPEVELRLKHLNPTFVVFGNDKPYYFGDCGDAVVAAKGEGYNKASLKRKLEEIAPQGVSALAKGIELAYKSKPDKVFVIADAGDTCASPLLTALRPTLTKSPSTVINVFSLGKVRAGDRKQMMNLAEKTGGRYFQPLDYDTLIKSWLEELSLNYELFSNNKSIHQSPLEDREFRLGPGTYTLKIPYGNQVKEVQLLLEHGTKTTLSVSGTSEGQDKRIQVDQVVTQL